jgi:small GTP-binding protein
MQGDIESVSRIVWSPDGRLIAAAIQGESPAIRIWDVASKRNIREFSGHERVIFSIAWASDSQRLASASADATARIWSLVSDADHRVLEHCSSGDSRDFYMVYDVDWSPDGKALATGSHDRHVRVWDVGGDCSQRMLPLHTGQFFCVKWSPDGQRLAAGSGIHGCDVLLWDLPFDEAHATRFSGHKGSVFSLDWSPDGNMLATASADRTVRVFRVDNQSTIAILEGHTDHITDVCFSHDGRLLASKSTDSSVRLWRTDDWAEVACIPERSRVDDLFGGVAFHPRESVLATAGEEGDECQVRIWDLDTEILMGTPSRVREYASVKVVLAGETGVGKTALSFRLTEDRFKSDTHSTDGAWGTQLPLPNENDGEDLEREIWLWDFAGQSDYRLIHQLFMAETAVAVLMFNPQSENPFDGIAQWDEDLQRAARQSFKRILVAGRCDRGGLVLSEETFQRFLSERRFDKYIETSALTEQGCDELREAIIDLVPWDSIPRVSSPKIFQMLREKIMQLADRGRVLIRMNELEQHLETQLGPRHFTRETLETVVQLLAGSGAVWQLNFGDFVLLQPERINAYAAAVIRKVRDQSDEMGSIPEHDLIAGELDYQDMQRLLPGDEQIVLMAMHQTLVNRGICLRQDTPTGTLLVFPSYFRRERPESLPHPPIAVTYRFRGALEELYATLVVRLYYTLAFENDQLWRFAADFKTHGGKPLGLRLNKMAESEGELVVRIDPMIDGDTQVTFLRYVHDYLVAGASEVKRFRHYTCRKCQWPVKDLELVASRLESGEKDVLCLNCEKRVPLWDLIEQKFASEEAQGRVRDLEDRSRQAISNESRELILVGETFTITGKAGHIFRATPSSDWGIDGEIEFMEQGKASPRKLYLQLKSGDAHLYKRSDGTEVFRIKKERHVAYWRDQAYPVMLVIRSSDGRIRWMDIRAHLRDLAAAGQDKVKQVIFVGESFTVEAIGRKARELGSSQ